MTAETYFFSWCLSKSFSLVRVWILACALSLTSPLFFRTSLNSFDSPELRSTSLSNRDFKCFTWSEEKLDVFSISGGECQGFYFILTRLCPTTYKAVGKNVSTTTLEIFHKSLKFLFIKTHGKYHNLLSSITYPPAHLFLP